MQHCPCGRELQSLVTVGCGPCFLKPARCCCSSPFCSRSQSRYGGLLVQGVHGRIQQDEFF